MAGSPNCPPRGLAELSSSCQRLLCAYYVEGRSLREAARLVSLQYSSVAKTISRCVKKLPVCILHWFARLDEMNP